ncbi:hypothetical protein GQF03_04975 [Sneathiella chungangensis]|uniref:Glycosyltransferase RgtA/B/C/D-like domain-containing protein n=1 Tax=Sneathiella chungangensis TaxID=1418234 RepID=A0A845MF44_9PROT|nr:hypothetical protein [Sneathiella chungangensis]MZR21674.1 hypothetical protein [Sneathiella chungangensis]
MERTSNNIPIGRSANMGAAAIFLFLTILLAAGRPPYFNLAPPAFLLLFSVLITILIMRLAGTKKATLPAILSIAGFLAVIAIWAFATQILYDAGHDGHSYHLPAIWAFVEGWNPFLSSHDNIWVDSYPNGYWALQSYIVAMTEILLSGRALTVGLIAAVYLLAFGFFLDRSTYRSSLSQLLQAALFSAIVVANPVVLTQIMTHYVDGVIYLLGTALILFLLSDAFSGNRLTRWAAMSCIILMVNTKTASLYYVPLFVLGALAIEWIFSDTRISRFQNLFVLIRSKGIPYGLAFFIGILLIGFKPYVTNVSDHGQFLYPSVDKIMDTNIPVNLEPLSVPMKFVYGILSRTEDSVWPVPVTAPVELKIPGSVKLFEFKDLDFDTRRGGFGPLFSLSLILALAAYAIGKLARRKNGAGIWRKEEDAFALFGFVLVGASAFFPESWWARYIPFIWLSVFLIAYSAMRMAENGKIISLSRILFGLVVICFVVNIAAGALGALRQSWHTYQRTAVIEQMKSFRVVELALIEDPRTIADHQSTLISSSDKTWTRLLEDRGVNTTIVQEINKEECEHFGFFDGNVLWCVRK